MQIPSLLLHQVAITFRSTIPEELPHISRILNLVEVQVRHDHFFLIARPFSEKLSARRTEVALAVELSNIPRLFTSHAIDCPDEIAVGDRVRRLFQFPKVLAEA